jgi:hypothetical protein
VSGKSLRGNCRARSRSTGGPGAHRPRGLDDYEGSLQRARFHSIKTAIGSPRARIQIFRYR